jgi:long-chain acyl-CoA synthetase
MKTLNDLLDLAARENGSKIAVVMQEQTMTYSQLHELTARAAAGLHAAGVRAGSCVAIIHRNDSSFIATYFALARLGAIAVPINFMVKKPEELAYMLNDCKAVGVVTQKEFLNGIREAATKTPSIKNLWITDTEGPATMVEKPYDDLLKSSDAPPPTGVDAEDVAGILYTSGTTGNPKGVMLTHRNLVTNCDNSAKCMGLKKSDVVLCILPMFHTFAWTANVLVAVRLGAKLVVAANIAPAKPWLTLMGRHGVSLFTAVPQVYAVLAKEASGLKGLVLKWWFFRRVRLCISGAAPLTRAVQSAFEAAFGLPILEGYGLTETSPVATINPPNDPRPGTVGTPIPGVEVKVIDDEERTLAPGQAGEVCIRGDNVMKGYFNLPEATKQSLTTDGWFKTGDIGVIDESGYLSIKDRKKDMIIVKGLKVFSAQVEAVLAEHPDVEEAAIIGIPDETGSEQIKAFFVLRKGAAADKAALMQFCRQKLDAYKRPRDIEIVTSLPKNALQKVLKRSLRQQELQKKAAA